MSATSKIIYLDHNATTPVDSRVLAAMLPYITLESANPSSQHLPGWQARDVVEKSRSEIAQCIGARDPQSIFFTSGATESNNLILLGCADSCGLKIISQVTEHSSVLEPLQILKKRGTEINFISVGSNGIVNLDELKNILKKWSERDVKATPTDNTCERNILVSIMLAQNETGVIQPLKEIVKICHAHGAIVHTDATQAVGKISVDVSELDVDLMSFSAHKLGGPKGIGAVYIAPRKPKIHLSKVTFGGGHENGLRPGTLNVPAIVGMSEALKTRRSELSEIQARWKNLKNILLSGLSRFCETKPSGDFENSLANTLNVKITGIRADQFILRCPEIAFATGAACSSNHTEPSHVLLAMGLTHDEASASVRFSFGAQTTEDDILRALKILQSKIVN